MFTINETSDVTKSFPLPGSPTGPIYVRVQDTDRSNKESQLDTVFVDQMFIRSNGSSVSWQLPTGFVSGQAESARDGRFERGIFWLPAIEEVLPTGGQESPLPAMESVRETLLAVPATGKEVIDELFADDCFDSDHTTDLLTGLTPALA